MQLFVVHFFIARRWFVGLLLHSWHSQEDLFRTALQQALFSLFSAFRFWKMTGNENCERIWDDFLHCLICILLRNPLKKPFIYIGL